MASIAKQLFTLFEPLKTFGLKLRPWACRNGKVQNGRHYLIRFEFGNQFLCFDPIFLPEVDEIENWATIQNLVGLMRNTTHIPSFKKIGPKLWPWQCYRFFLQYGGRKVIKHFDELKLKRTQVDILGTICGKFHWNRLGSLGVLARTDT